MDEETLQRLETMIQALNECRGSTEMLVSMMKQLADLLEELKIAISCQTPDIKNHSIEELFMYGLTARSYNCCCRLLGMKHNAWGKGEITIGMLADCTENDLLKVRQFGQGCLNNVKYALSKIGLNLKEATE